MAEVPHALVLHKSTQGGLDVRSFSTLRDIMKTLDSILDLPEAIASF